MRVYLLAYTQNAEQLVAAAAKLCYSKTGVDRLMDGLTPQKSAEFLDMLNDLGHQSPVEHASFTFGIEGVSRTLLAQITRHRIASFSVQSQRYVEYDKLDYVTPPEIAACPEALELFNKAMADSAESYKRLSEILQQKHKQELIDGGADEKTAARAAQKQSIEDARFVLPGACETKMVVTMNARSLMHFFNIRCCNRAQWEIRELANEMLRLASAAAPSLFKGAGPSCVNGPCPEGRMSCGRAAEVREKFKKLKEVPTDER